MSIAKPFHPRRLAATVALAAAVSFSGTSDAVSVGSSPGSGGGFTWGVGAGANCSQVVEKIRRNWMDVRRVIAPKSKQMRPRSRDFYCVSPAYVQDAIRRVVPMTSGLECFDVQGKGFCCDRSHRQCATM